MRDFLNDKSTLTCILGSNGISSEITQKHAVKTYNENNAASIVNLGRTSSSDEADYVWFDTAEEAPYGTWQISYNFEGSG